VGYVVDPTNCFPDDAAGRCVDPEQYFLFWLRMIIADEELRFRLPKVIHDSAGQLERDWASYPDPPAWSILKIDYKTARRSSRRPPAFSGGLFLAAECAEFPVAGGAPALETLQRNQAWPNVFGLERIDHVRVCPEWNLSPIGAASRQPVVSDAPVLLLSGENDVVTPPSWGERAKQTLTHGTHIVAPHKSHGTSGSSRCIGPVASRFLRTGGTLSPDDLACISGMSHPPWDYVR
jgi:pimeloyl-ACP methyl ester carboxylesterase